MDSQNVDFICKIWFYENTPLFLHPESNHPAFFYSNETMTIRINLTLRLLKMFYVSKGYKIKKIYIYVLKPVNVIMFFF